MQNEEAVLLIGDVHAGRRTVSYNLAKMVQRFERLAEDVNTILDIHRRAYNVDKLNIFMLGDMLQGENVLRQMMLEDLDATLVEQKKALVDGLEVFLGKVASKNWSIFGVMGNHGRLSKPSSSLANHDYGLYEYLNLRYGDRVVVPRKDYQVARVLGHGFLLTHGCNIRSYLGLPFYGVTARALRWKQSIPNWDVLCMGHFHTLQELNFSGVPIFMNGTFVSDDEYPVNTLGLVNDTRMWMFGVHPDRPVTWRYALDLDPDESTKPLLVPTEPYGD